MKKLHKQELFYNMLLESDNGPVSVIPENPDDRKVFQAFYDAEVFGISHLLIGGYKKCIIISDSEKRNADIGSHQKELVGKMVFLLQTCSGPDRSERKYLAAAEIQEALSHAAVMNLNKRAGEASCLPGRPEKEMGI